MSERDSVKPEGSELASCTACASGMLARDKVKSAFWHGDHLVVIEDVPALVCQICGERYYEDETVMALDMMRGTSFPPDQAMREMMVKIYPFRSPKTGGDDE